MGRYIPNPSWTTEGALFLPTVPPSALTVNRVWALLCALFNLHIVPYNGAMGHLNLTQLPCLSTAPPPPSTMYLKISLIYIFFCHIFHIMAKTTNAIRGGIICVDKWWQFVWQNGFCDLPHLPHTNPVTFT
jgi:hypothetical protein